MAASSPDMPAAERYCRNALASLRRRMEVSGRNRSAEVFANVGVHADVEITLIVDRHCGAAIHFGHSGPDLIMDFADADSLERLAAVAANGARELRARMAADVLDSAGRC